MTVNSSTEIEKDRRKSKLELAKSIVSYMENFIHSSHETYVASRSEVREFYRTAFEGFSGDEVQHPYFWKALDECYYLSEGLPISRKKAMLVKSMFSSILPSLEITISESPKKQEETDLSHVSQD